MMGFYLLSSFMDHFGVTSNRTVAGGSFTNPASSSFEFINSVFFDMSQGAILFDTNMYFNASIEECVFYYCRNGRNGGAITFLAESAQLVISKACGHSCYIHRNEPYQFAHISISNNKINHLLSSTISSCSPDHLEDRSHGFLMAGGNQIIHSTNISKAYGCDMAAYYTDYATLFEFSFNTIANCVAKRNHVIGFNKKHQIFPFNISFCNVVGNIDSPTGGVIVAGGGAFRFQNCIFMQNTITLFSLNQPIIVQSCYIYHLGTVYTKSSPTIIDVKTISMTTATYTLMHFSTHVCGEIESNTHLRTYPPEPTSCDSILSSNNGAVLLLESVFHMVLASQFLQMIF